MDVKLYKSILDDMQTWIIANQDKITDFNEGSVITSLLEAFAREMEQLYTQVLAGYETYLNKMPYDAFDFARKLGSYAGGDVVFSRDTPTTDVISIPTGTQVATSAGLVYETTADGEIASMATDSAGVPVRAVETGDRYNVPALAISIILSALEGVDSVSNALAIIGGQSDEADVEYKQRFMEYIRGLAKSNKSGIIAAVKEIVGIRSASIVEHFPPDTLYNFTVYIDDGAGTASAALIAEAELVVIGDGTDLYPGCKAAGTNCRVLAPTRVTVDVAMDVTDDGTIAEEAIQYAIESAVTDYINSLELGEDVIWAKLVGAVADLTGVSDVDVTTPAANVSIAAAQIARIGTITVNFV